MEFTSTPYEDSNRYFETKASFEKNSPMPSESKFTYQLSHKREAEANIQKYEYAKNKC